MKYLTYILRNARRNPVRSLLTIASTSICLFLMMILLSFFAISDEASAVDADLQPDRLPQRQRVCRHDPDRAASRRSPSSMACVAGHRRSAGSAASTRIEIDAVRPVRRRSRHGLHGHRASSRFPPDQLKAFQENKDGCVIGRKLADDKKLKVGDTLPLEGRRLPGRPGPDGPGHLRRAVRTATCGCAWCAGTTSTSCSRSVVGSAARPAASARRFGQRGHDLHQVQDRPMTWPCCARRSTTGIGTASFPTRTQTEEAFGKMFEEMLGDLKGMIRVDRPGRGLLAPLRRGQFDGHVDARADQRGGRAQGDRLQPAADAVHGPDRGGAGRRASAA